MEPALIPEPKRLIPGQGFHAIPASGTIAISGAELHPLAEEARALFKRHRVGIALPGLGASLTVAVTSGLKPGGYRLDIARDSVRLEGDSVAAAYHGLQTLRQLALQSPPGRLPVLRIDDWPDLAERGVYYDVCRGRVPKLERLMEQAELLSRHKINQFQLYIEHTFRFRGHPAIGRGASPLTAEDILRLDAHCRRHHVELVPSLASFGHLQPVLSLKPYRHLAEDWGVGKYLDPEAKALPHLRPAWSLAPGNPETYTFLDSLFAEFLPLFTSSRFNVCCDETFDLGLGQSYELCRRKGRGRFYLDHLLRLRELAAKYGKTIMFWGDIIRKYPELLAELPKDVLVLHWKHRPDYEFDSIASFSKAGVDCYGCPGTSSWSNLFPNLPAAMVNIHGFAQAAATHGAQGLLNTDWGDGGHMNFMELSWHGYLFGAEQAWNVGADRSSFTRRFARLFLGTERVDVVKAIETLGDITEPYWRLVLFSISPMIDSMVKQTHTNWVWKDGAAVARKVRLTAALGRSTRKRLDGIRTVFAQLAAERHTDPNDVLAYWLFAVDTLRCAAAKLAAFGPGGRDTPAVRATLRAETRELMQRFERLWLARNRPSNLRATLKRFRGSIWALDHIPCKTAPNRQPRMKDEPA